MQRTCNHFASVTTCLHSSGVWLKALGYYSENLEAAEEIVQAFPNSDDAICVALVREILKGVNTKKKMVLHTSGQAAF